MTNTLCIRSESWPDVTDRLHFIVEIIYEGCRLAHEDIYFDDESSVVSGLDRLNKTRSGQVILDGGERFSLSVESMTSGGLTLRFKGSADATFPGKLNLEGFFLVDGEYAETTIKALTGIFQKGGDFVI